ncbi:predicted protein [Nematostella vectensis]|uniref:Dehydrogenase/reductase SDR family member 7 n=1 Tax=Nematostella vectensis TaxID=45351 RepID=A7SSS1_NEMVE|nr:predicted protein [Nematostella vectensis]|eukprot:XP_001625357.1 predicted protein [Nematostella vectensis]
MQGKVAWITGASSGIGEFLAYQLAGNGCKLVLSARRKQELDRVKRKCLEIAKKANPEFNESDIMVLPMDLVNFSTHVGLADQVISHFEKIDILVNNGGVSQRGFVRNTPLDVDKYLLDINLFGTISLTKAVLPHMEKKKQGQIVVLSSVMGKWGFPYEATYSASKFALHGYFDALRLEVEESNINILMVCPGPVKSEVAKNAVTEKLNQVYTENYTDNQASRMPTERCAYLTAVAMANNLQEVWISTHPVLAITYMSQYTPWFFHQ